MLVSYILDSSRSMAASLRVGILRSRENLAPDGNRTRNLRIRSPTLYLWTMALLKFHIFGIEQLHMKAWVEQRQ